MPFSSNPLSLSVPEPAFESWLGDTGYLEILDQSSSAAAAVTSTTAAQTTATAANIGSSISSGYFYPFYYQIRILFSIFLLNPFSKLTADDFSGQTPSWTHGFIGFFYSYSLPSSSSQARLRVYENVKRYARNYATLFIICFACALYQMPLALVGLISSMALWDFFKFCSDKWGLNQYPVAHQILVRIGQCVTAVILICSNIQMALFSALGIGYAVMILHAAMRKLTPSKQPSRGRWK